MPEKNMSYDVGLFLVPNTFCSPMALVEKKILQLQLIFECGPD
jgi:hypothetical protein